MPGLISYAQDIRKFVQIKWQIITSKSFSAVPGAKRILSLMIDTRSPTLLVLGMYTFPTPRRDCFDVSKCLRNIMIDCGGISG